ncbi:MAG: methyltransferase domain-containing protein [Gammaproteobacteria bacterium]|nr:methyltransferase domain-containing protein [Gammaproteobacteria bacterium]
METDSLSAIYDRFAESYDGSRDVFNIDEIINDFQSRLISKNGNLLDLGCGAGVPFARSFVDFGWNVTGVDFSEKMIALANQNVPEMHAIHSDICNVKFENEYFDAVTGIYSLFHISRDQHEAVFKKIHGWLKQGGCFLFTYATEEYTGKSEFDGYKEFMGEKLFYSHDKPEILYSLLERVGLSVESSEKHTIAGETFLWITGQKMS